MSRLNQHDQYIREAAAAGTARTHIARSLGVARSTLSTYMDKHKIEVARAQLASPTPTAAGDTVSREEILEAQVIEPKSQLRKGRKASVADERVLQVLEAAAGAYVPRPADPALSFETPSGEAHHRQVLLLSDFHGGEVVDSGVVNGLNSYNWQIMEDRVEQLLAGVASHIRRSPELTGLDVLFLGDQCSGANHDEIKETNQYTMAEQGIRMGDLMAEILRRLSALVPDLRVGAVEGNHPRMDRAPAAKNPHNNMDYVAAMFTRALTKDIANLSRFDIGQGSLFWQVAGRNAYVFHGDGIRSSMPGVPWGGVVRRSDQLTRTYSDRRIDHFWFGHFHQAHIIDGGRLIGNGSLKGADEWCLKNFGAGGVPTQILQTFDEKKCRLTDVRFLTPTAGLPG